MILVIVRWNDKGSRDFLRNTIGKENRFKNHTNTQLLFVFGLPNSVKLHDLDEIYIENRQFNDMIIPGKHFLFNMISWSPFFQRICEVNHKNLCGKIL